ncbi:hypothetical protein K438DRAFT_1986014 [Mycena galopus ATCC 62051]|nr:hypothetical protein K438DRAFT_1986014 [Mycena galopus ATCC 62051]
MSMLPCRKNSSPALCSLPLDQSTIQEETAPCGMAEPDVAQLENKQRIEDAEALKFTDEQRFSLLLSLRSAKIEWSNLDGMWTVRKYYNAFAVLTSARLASDDTIRRYIPFLDRHFYSTPPPYDPAPRYSTKYQPEYKYSNAPATLAPSMPPTMQRSPLRVPKLSKSSIHRRKRCSPVKGLVSIASSATAACLQVVRVPPPATCLYGSDQQADGPDDGNEEGWVNDDELAVTADDGHYGAKYHQPILVRVLLCASHCADDALDVSSPVRCVRHPHHRRYRAPRSHRNLGETKLPWQRPVPSLHHLSVLLPCSGVRAAHLCTLPPLVSAASNGSAETGDSEDAWVDKDDVTVTIDHDDRRDWMLTPVPACVWSLGSTTDVSSACRNSESTPFLHLNCRTPPSLRVDSAVRHRCCRLHSAATATGGRHTHTTLEIWSRSCARHCCV